MNIQGFPGLFQNGTLYRFGKKICFENNPTHKDVLGAQMEQMRGRSEQRQRDFEGQRESDRQLLEDIKAQMREDKQKKYEMLLNSRKLLEGEYQRSKLEREQKKIRERERSLGEKIDFFPFTHGESVQVRREEYKAELNQEMKKQLAKQNEKSGQITAAHSFYP